MTDTVVDIGGADRLIEAVGAGGALMVSDADAVVDGDQTSPTLKRISPADLPAATETTAGILSTDLFARAALLDVVTPEEKGALGDGAADDYTPWTQALADLEAAGGGVFLLQRHYRLSVAELAIPENVIVLCKDAQVTVDGVAQNLFVLDGTAARKSRVAILGPLRVAFADAGAGDAEKGHVIFCRRASDVLLRDVRAIRGKLIRTALRSDFPTRVADALTIPDVTAATETSMAAELNFDIRIERCEVEGVPGVTDAADAGAAVALEWVSGFRVEGLRAAQVRHAVRWQGGDPDPQRDGHGAQWARDGVVCGVRTKAATAAAVFGLCCRDVETSDIVTLDASENRVGRTAVDVVSRGANPNGTDPSATKTAFDQALAEVIATGGGIVFPEGEFLIDSAFAPVRQDSGAGAVGVDIMGMGPSRTKLRPTAAMLTPLINYNRLFAATGPLGTDCSLQNFWLDFDGQTGTAFRFHMAKRMTLRDLRVTDCAGLVLDGVQWWDSSVINCYLEDCGVEGTQDADDGTPVVQLRNLDPADANSSCNNLMFWHLHVENHKSWAIKLLDSARQNRFVNLKCHHDPGAFPPLGHGHVMIDRRNASGGPAQANAFVSPRLAVSSGPGLLLRNTGGARDAGPRDIHLLGGSIDGQAYGAVRIEAANGFRIDGGTSIRQNGVGNGRGHFHVHEGAAKVAIAWDDLNVATHTDDGATAIPPILYDGDGYTTRPADALEIQSGAIPFVGSFARVDVEGLSGTGTITRIEPGTHGAVMTLRSASAARAITLDHGADNLDLRGGADVTLDAGRRSITLRYDAVAATWNEP